MLLQVYVLTELLLEPLSPRTPDATAWYGRDVVPLPEFMSWLLRCLFANHMLAACK